ncbi:GDP-fucose protein O-fucosyltransferase 2 [Cydia pomonella]|uniref:GDP-fucose protein O-fucosyltransferase 2 n=1 Tax=Cydia pomonella TaxID=82600 RepID=UPI002ADE8425|nr:GDP-fucose protein O-fucosyltransferase 2 [Cydia pomonella]
MVFICVFLINLLFAAAQDSGYCDASSKSCDLKVDEQKLIFYDVNPPEGFNLRRDVYMRFAIMLAEAQKHGKRNDWQLVLPPWYHLYHWKISRKPTPWGHFFDLNSLKSYAPVTEMYEVMSRTPKLTIDRLYILQNFEDAFEGGNFKEKWEISKDECYYEGFWGYNNITVKEKVCVKFQGKISKLWELVQLHSKDTKIMFSHGEIPLHDSYGTKSFWDCRWSMKFNNKLIKIATKYMADNLNCYTTQCSTYLSIHWRRQDFIYGRKDFVPSIEGTAKQIDKAIKTNNLKIDKIFIATDAYKSEIEKLEEQLKILNYKPFLYIPTRKDIELHGDGGIAIIDQIICSRSSYFIGTHESTFSFRIQEEREILGFDSQTTFNRFCPDKGKCDKPSKWTIVY